MRTANPALNAKTFIGFGQLADATKTMTIQGTTNKAALLLLLVLIPASWTWSLPHETVMPWMFVGAIGGFIVALVTVFKKTWAPTTAPIYALLVGRKKEIRRIRQAIAGPATPVVYIWGLGGIGKTALASKIIEKAMQDKSIQDHRVIRCNRLRPTYTEVAGKLARFLRF